MYSLLKACPEYIVSFAINSLSFCQFHVIPMFSSRYHSHKLPVHFNPKRGTIFDRYFSIWNIKCRPGLCNCFKSWPHGSKVWNIFFDFLPPDPNSNTTNLHSWTIHSSSQICIQLWIFVVWYQLIFANYRRSSGISVSSMIQPKQRRAQPICRLPRRIAATWRELEILTPTWVMAIHHLVTTTFKVYECMHPNGWNMDGLRPKRIFKQWISCQIPQFIAGHRLLYYCAHLKSATQCASKELQRMGKH